MHRSSVRRLFPLAPMFILLNGCGSGVTCLVPPVITGQPLSQAIAAGQSALFTVAAAGTAPLSYQWLKNGVEIPGATQASYITQALSADSGSTFVVNVTNGLGTSSSAPASLSV